ncbi:MAG TPA: zinc-ribbon domain-containing protein [Polyangiaceae bacterium]|nr:zinc-ribbon domain-containing protein [Polyangiaceae bacterium]
MKISCQSCQAKYTIADDKVLGKIVKIRCKKCAATIVVNGTSPAVGSAPGDGADAAQDDTSGEWTVNVSDGDQRTMTDAEVAAAYRSGFVNDETLCWRDGMADWAALREIPELHAACSGVAGGTARGLQGASAAELASSGAQAPATASAAQPSAAGDGPGIDIPRAAAAASAAAAPTAARRAGGGRAPIADLFGGVAQAGGEDDVMTSAPAKVPQADESQDPQKLTGARNENSVLFSLSALTGKSEPPPRSPDSEASGLIDIRQLSAQFGDDDGKKKSSRVDDIMNLSGGGFASVLTAPVLSAPTIEPYAEGRPGAAASLAPGAGRSKGLIFLALGVGALVIVGAVGGAMSIMHKGTDAAASASGVPSAPRATSSAAPDDSASAATAQSAVAQAESASAAPTPAAGAAPSASNAEPSASGAAAAGSPAQAPDTRTAKNASAPSKEAAAKTAPATTESDQPFNMGEAKAKLGAAAEGVQSCKRGDVTGTGHVVITFAPGGTVQSAAIEGAPFEGTAAGACVAAHFRAVRVPAFSGSPFKVRKSFTIN